MAQPATDLVPGPKLLGRTGVDALLGLGAGLMLAAALRFSDTLGLAFAAAVLAIPVILIRPGSLFWIMLLSILVLEEFPSGEGETAERALRNSFYGKSVGLPGLYLPDLMLCGVIAMSMWSTMLTRRAFSLHVDRIAWWLVALGGALTFSVLLSFIVENPLDYGVIQETSGTSFQINERGAQLIAFFQLKNFALLVLAYIAASFQFRDDRSLKGVARVGALAALAWVLLGSMRLALHPEWVAQTLPLFYDSQSSWLFALVCFYVVAAWGLNRSTQRQLLWQVPLCMVLMLFVLVSFRRTMWAAIVVGAIPLLIWLPPLKRRHLIVIGSLLFAIAFAALMASPAGGLIIKAMSARLEQTDVQDASTVYRLALFVHFAKHFDEIPFFGYGARPLWNEFVQLGYFRTNLENIHSLYFWLLLRLGYFGILVFFTGVGIVLHKAWSLARGAANPDHRILSLIVLQSLLIFLFSGIFNPVYAQPRYVVIVGIGLAVLSRIDWLNKHPVARP